MGDGAYRWQPGDQIVRRELCLGRPWLGQAVVVVEDSDELLALYVAEGSELAYPDGDWPGGRHPWHGKDRWRGHGVLQLQRPDEAHAVWLFWRGPEAALAFWYVNLQAPFRRTAAGIDTMDHELDIVIEPNGSWRFKDEELLDEWIRLGRWTEAEVGGDPRRGRPHRRRARGGQALVERQLGGLAARPGVARRRPPDGWEQA